MLFSKKQKSWKDEPVSFSIENLEGIEFPHDDAIVISVVVYNHVVKRIYFDNGSASDVLYYNTMKAMNIPEDKLKPFPAPLVGFGNEEVPMLRTITLPVTLGSEPRAITTMVEFMVVNIPSAYNMILGRPSQTTMGAIGSTPHLKIKFPTPQRIGEIRGDQSMARQCYMTVLKYKGKSKETFTIEISYQRPEFDGTRLELADELVQIPFNERDPEKLMQIIA